MIVTPISRISKRIENDNGYIEKPKEMHRNIYNKLVNQERDISLYVGTAIDRLLNNYRYR